MKRIFTKLILCLLATSALASHAGSIDLNDSVDLEESGYNIATAFRDSANCLVWRYMPNYVMASSSFLNGTDIDSVTQRDEATQKDVTYPAYVTALDFTVQSPLTDKNRLDLKAKILAHLKDVDQCMANVKPDSQVSLQAARIQAVPIETLNKNITSSLGSFQATLRPSFGNTNPDVMRDGINPITATLRADASNPNIVELLRGLIDLSKVHPVRLGEINYTVQGVVSKVNSHLIIKGDLKSIFEAKIKEECEHKESSTDALHTLGAGAEFGNLNQRSRTCSQKLLSDYKGGLFENIMEFKDNDSVFVVHGKPINYTWYDDKDEPQSANLQDFIHAEMFHLLIISRYDAAIGTIVNSTYAKSEGRGGTAQTDIHVDVGYMMNFEGQYTIKADVYAKDLDSKWLKTGWTKDLYSICVQKDYRERKFKAKLGANSYFTPLNDKCLSNKGDL